MQITHAQWPLVSAMNAAASKGQEQVFWSLPWLGVGEGSPFLPVAAHQASRWAQSLGKCKKQFLWLRCALACYRQPVREQGVSPAARSPIPRVDWQVRA